MALAFMRPRTSPAPGFLLAAVSPPHAMSTPQQGLLGPPRARCGSACGSAAGTTAHGVPLPIPGDGSVSPGAKGPSVATASSVRGSSFAVAASGCAGLLAASAAWARVGRERRKGYLCTGSGALQMVTSRSRCTEAAAAASATAVAGTLDTLSKCAKHSWLTDLLPDPEQEKYVPNRSSRQVRSGHYVLVDPLPLAVPYLVGYSAEMAEELGLSPEEVSTKRFAKIFGGDLEGADGFRSWATPYALSIYGHEMYDNCPFGNGNGYGDGRAMSIGEFAVASGKSWELQLKGGGPTPFCRGADGRAVLRSSVREFLVSEAMHHLGVETTRAVSLVASRYDSVMRPWYENQNPAQDLVNYVRRLLKEQTGIDFDTLSDEQQRNVQAQVKAQMRNPNRMQRERCAITCRAARSFLRVGHVELFARRVRRQQGDNPLLELELVVQHALDREYPDVAPGQPLKVRAVAMLREAARRLARLAASWLRVGYVQGNFNSDNCLVGGRTMDYGPFGFIERYEPFWNMWVGGQEKYGFLNQPNAAFKNFESLAKSVMVMLEKEQCEEVEQIIADFGNIAAEEVSEVWRTKLGLTKFEEEEKKVFGELEQLLRASNADYTIFWRSLAGAAEQATVDNDDSALVDFVRPCFYGQLSPEGSAMWATWLRKWLAVLSQDGRPPSEIAAGMRAVSPKYIPREWMLVAAYNAAADGDQEPLLELQALFRAPYAEQPAFEERFFRRTPPEVQATGGISWMT